MDIFRQFLDSPVWGKARTILLVFMLAGLVSSCSPAGTSGRRSSGDKSGEKAASTGGGGAVGAKGAGPKGEAGKPFVSSKVYSPADAAASRDPAKPALPAYIENEKDPVKRDYLIWRFGLMRVANKLDIAQYGWQKTFQALSDGKLSKEHASQQLDQIQKELVAAKGILDGMVTPKTLKKEHQSFLDEAKSSMGEAVSSWEAALESAKGFLRDEQRKELAEKAVAEIKKARTAVMKAAEDSLKVKRDLGLAQGSKS